MTCALRGEKPLKEMLKCPICGVALRKSITQPRRGKPPSPFNHLYSHSKGDLVRLLLRMLKVPKSNWFKK